MYVRGKVNYVDNIDVDLFNVDELHMFLQDLGYDPKQLMFYHYKLPNKSLDYGLRPLSCDADVVSLINLVANCKVVEVFVEYWLTSVDHQYLSPFKSTVEIEELDDDVLLNAPVVGSSKRLALDWINEADVRESSVGKNDNVNVVGSSKSLALGWVNEADVDGNVHEEQTVNVNDYTIDVRFELDIYENLNLDDYTVYVDENMNENVNVDENMNENVNADDENVNADNDNVNADDEYEQDDVEDEEVICNDREDFIVDEEHVIDEVEVNMEGDDTASITRRSLRASGKDGFRASGRQLLGLDRAFMKGNYSGQLLTAVNVDANNGIYLGLLPALKDLFPAAEHIYYVRHIHDNMNMIYKGGHYKELLWKCATTTTKVHFERAMDEFKGYNRLTHEWLRKIHPKHWIRSQFSGKENCDLLINNICEVFNRQLLEARDSPVITALEYVREYLMKRIVIVQKVIEKSQGPLTPNVAKIFNAIKEKASQCVVVWNGAELFQVNEVACIFNMNDNGMQVGLPED
ncbi:hypothetical protein Tco_1035581 [Tanacetum coccineum]